ncbi:M16 family metallopeptidase [Frigidibacter sp. MR17.24]|uniref:M16 family metallopeptidase n=1 Tax=Frigidibacter sp. MR17.24 TaxID=3127345 RepID=UPI003012F21B
MIRSLISATVSAGFLLVATQPAAAAVDIQEVSSPAGLTAWLVEDHTLPFVALDISFRGGASLDAPGKRGAINLMAGMLEEGCGDRDSRGFAEAREALAASYSFDAGDDTVSIGARMLTENRDQAVALLKCALTRPSFAPDALERVRGQVLSGIAAEAVDPQALAAKAFGAQAFGDHPYATSVSGTADSVQGLTADDLRDAKDRVLARDRIVISAAGDITPEALGKLIDELTAELPATGAEMPGRAPMDLTGGVTIVPFDTPQSVVIFGEKGIKRDDPDFFPAYVLNQIIGGGGFSSRLMQEVREKRGLTYGAYSYIVPRDFAETWQGSFASSNDKVAEAVQVVRDVWTDIAQNGVTEAELEAAKTYLLGSYPLRFDGSSNIASILDGMQLDHLTPDYVETRDAKVEAVSLEDIKRVAAEYIRPDALRFVVTGQPAGLAASN